MGNNQIKLGLQIQRTLFSWLIASLKRGSSITIQPIMKKLLICLRKYMSTIGKNWKPISTI